MSSVGSYLRKRREARGVSLKEMARSTRVRQRYLEALESDNFAELPAGVFAKGFIRAYCQILNEPPEGALRLFAEQTGAQATPGEGSRVTRLPERDGRGREPVLISLILLIVLGAALFGLTFALQGRPKQTAPPADRRSAMRPAPPGEPVALRSDPTATVAPAPAPLPPTSPTPVTASPPQASLPAAPAQGPPPGPTSPRPSIETPRVSGPAASPPGPIAPRPVTATPPHATALATPTASAQGPPLGPTLPRAVTADPSQPVAPLTGGPYRLVARVKEKTWVRVRSEDGRVTEEMMSPGEVREWVSNRRLVLTIGNAGGLALELNGRPLPPLGPSGAVIQQLVIPPDRQ